VRQLLALANCPQIILAESRPAALDSHRSSIVMDLPRGDSRDHGGRADHVGGALLTLGPLGIWLPNVPQQKGKRACASHSKKNARHPAKRTVTVLGAELPNP
jgi:hypothetical protein